MEKLLYKEILTTSVNYLEITPKCLTMPCYY